MTSPDKPLLAVRSTADLIAAVPYLLGFHPTDSVVVVAMRGKRVVFVARGDLPNPVDRGDLPSSGAPDEGVEAAEYIGGVVGEQDAEAATVLGYGPDDRVGPAVRQLGDVLDRRGIRVLDLLRVSDGRYWSYTCGNPECCPPDGTAFDPTTSAVVAAAVFAGQVALPDRETLTGQVAPVAGVDREEMDRAGERAEQRLDDLIASITAAAGGAAPADGASGRPARRRRRRARSLPEAPAALSAPTTPQEAVYAAGTAAVEVAVRRHREGGVLTDDEVAWLGLLLLDLPVRDHAWERTDGDEASLSLWTEVLRRVDVELAAAPASLLAFAAWRAGQGALALVALDRAFEALPDYSMARLMEDVLRRGVRPSRLGRWPKPPRPHRET